MPRIYHTLNIGVRGNDRTGDSQRVAAKKINANFAMLFEGSAGEFVNRASDFNAVKFTTYLVDTTGGAITATLPNTAVTGDCVRFIDSENNFENNALNVTSTAKINASESAVVHNESLSVIEYTYINSIVGWIRT